jgi:hypothetical protein
VSLDFHVTDKSLGDIMPSDGIDCAIDQSTHNELFQDPKITIGTFPYLSRFRDYYADAYVEHESLQFLIGEIEQVSIHFEYESNPKKILRLPSYYVLLGLGARCIRYSILRLNTKNRTRYDRQPRTAFRFASLWTVQRAVAYTLTLAKGNSLGIHNGFMMISST